MTARRVGLNVVLALSLAAGASAHRLDEYLQATLIGVARNGTDVEIQLTPGVAILPVLMAVIDLNRDGRISPDEERTYVGRVVREVELHVDGALAPLALIESRFPDIEAMREGLGTIRIKLHSPRSGHRLHFENRHLPQLSVYLVNCLAAPSDGLTVTHQERDEAQKSITFDYAFGASTASPIPLWLAAIGILLLAKMLILFSRMGLPACPGGSNCNRSLSNR